MVEFGEQLRRAREAKGMTQQSLAEQLYVTRQSVSRWECGDRYPDLLTTQKISQILEVSLDDLLSGKEMTKVVERNPVVENKVVNNIIIVLYASVVLSYIMMGINYALRAQVNDYIVQGMYIQILSVGTSIAAFMYGLVNAIRGSLSPKRMGIVLMAYYLAACIVDIERMLVFNSLKVYLVLGLIDMLPSIIGIAAAYYFFIHCQNKKLWVVVISAVSAFGICYSARMIYYSTIMVKEQSVPIAESFLSAEFVSISAVLSIAIDALVLYQTITLYRKRVAAAEIAASDAD